MSTLPPPFPRTTCACPECIECCRRQPGPLVPGDLERIASYLGETVDAVLRYFCASPGALVADTIRKRVFHIGTITPRRQPENGACVFLDEHDRCRIHAVAPAGCALFDMHMGVEEGALRARWMAIEQQGDRAYQERRATLPFTEEWGES